MANFFFVDIPPNASTPMRFNQSLDMALMLLGELVMELPSGHKTFFKPGDCLVDRGVTHKSYNPSETEWARIAVVAMPAEKVILPDGKGIGES